MQLAAGATVTLIVIGLVGQLVRDRFFVTHLMLHAPLVPSGAAALVFGMFWRGGRLMRATLLVSGVAGIASGAWPMIGRGPAPSPTDVGQEMTIIQWNVRWGGGGGGGVDGAPARWASICDDIAGHAPDIVTLSEAPSPAYVGQLGYELGAGWTSVQVRNAPRARYLYSLAVCSRWPVTLEREIEIPTGRAMLATVAGPRGAVRVLVVDGESSPRIVRIPRLRAVSDICRDARASFEPIHVVAGDFNALGSSLGFDAMRDGGYALVSRSTRGWRGTWPAICPLYDIDHVWLSDDAAVMRCDLFTNFATDHRGTGARVRLPDAAGR